MPRHATAGGIRRVMLALLLLFGIAGPAFGAITISPAVLPIGTFGQPYQQALVATGGTAPYLFGASGQLPDGLALAADGVLSGTPTSVGTFAFTVTVVDATQVTGSQAYALQIVDEPVVLSPGSLADGTVGTPYVQDIVASGGGNPPYAFSVSAGALPDGLSLGSTGRLDGTPMVAGSFAFEITATDVGFDYTGSQAYSLQVNAPNIVLDPPALADATVGVDYQIVLAASGGNGPYTFAVSAGALAPGLLLDSDGTLHGAPLTAGSYAFTVAATDNFNQVGEQAYVLTVAAATIVLAPGTLPDALVGAGYQQPITASGGTAPYVYAVSAGQLPPGMAMDGDGIVDSTPTQAGIFAFTVSATDAFGQVGEQAYALQVLAPVIVLQPATLPAGLVGSSYAQLVTATGGTSPYTFALAAGALPAGLFLSSDGTLEGTPVEAGSFPVTIAATDNYNQVGTQAYTLAVAGPLITIAPATLPVATAGQGYAQAVTASGGTAPYQFGLGGGALPTGLALSADGELAGTPTVPGTSTFDIVATDAFGQTGTASRSIVVEAAMLQVTPGTLPAPSVGMLYQVLFEAGGGVAPYAFALAGGALPPGLALGGDGELAGTPTAGGDYVFTVEATDAIGNTGRRDYLLSLAALPDPTGDPDVIGLVTSQVSTVRVFATTQISNVHHHLETLHDGGETGWSVWIAGTVRQGDRDGNAEASPMAFETSGITGGTDYRPSQRLAFGGGLGYARDRTSVGDEGSRNDGDAPSGVSYMSWHPEDMPFFLDGMGGYQDIEFDVQRATASGARFVGRRAGKQRFSSWQGGYEHRTDRFLFSPYGRVDAASARLQGFREVGDDPLALQFGAQDVDLRSTTLGFRMHYRMATGWGEWEPRVRLEYQRDFHEDEGVSIRYANLAESPVFFTTPMGLDEDRFVLELGSLFRMNWHGLLVRVDYLGVYGGNNDNEHAVTFSFQED